VGDFNPLNRASLLGALRHRPSSSKNDPIPPGFIYFHFQICISGWMESWKKNWRSLFIEIFLQYYERFLE